MLEFSEDRGFEIFFSLRQDTTSHFSMTPYKVGQDNHQFFGVMVKRFRLIM